MSAAPPDLIGEQIINMRRQLDEARRDAARMRAALERLAEQKCAFDGSYANCWEAIEADDIDAGEGIPCARCVSLQVLEASAPAPAMPAEMLAVLRDTSIPLPGEEDAMNQALAAGVRITDAMRQVLARGCAKCMAAEHPYWHPADRPCPSTDTPAPAPNPPQPPPPTTDVVAPKAPMSGRGEKYAGHDVDCAIRMFGDDRKICDCDFQPQPPLPQGVETRVSVPCTNPDCVYHTGHPVGPHGHYIEPPAPAIGGPKPRAFAVVYGSYADDEVHALYKTRELAQGEANRLGGMWEVAEWVINDEPDVASSREGVK